MRKILTFWLSVAFLLIQKTTFAQFSIGIATGYGFKLASTRLLTKTIAQPDGTKTIETINASLGNGITYSLNVDYRWEKTFAPSLVIGYFSGTAQEGFAQFPGQTTTRTMKGNMLQIAPSLKVYYNMKSINMYIRGGVNFGLNNSITRTWEIDKSSGPFIEQVREYGGVAIGFLSGVGGELSISKKIALSLEIFSNHMSYAPTKGVLERYISNGQDFLPTVPEPKRHTEYLDTIISSPNIPSDPTKPNIALRTHYPFSSVGIKVGLLYKI